MEDKQQEQQNHQEEEEQQDNHVHDVTLLQVDDITSIPVHNFHQEHQEDEHQLQHSHTGDDDGTGNDAEADAAADDDDTTLPLITDTTIVEGTETNHLHFKQEQEERLKEEPEEDQSEPLHVLDSAVQPAITTTPDTNHLLKQKQSESARQSFVLDDDEDLANASGTEEEQSSFMRHLESFCKENCVDYKPLKFYQEPLNMLKLYRYVIRLGGYEKVTACKLWRQVGESFRPPKTCTTVSWTFRVFYEKSLLEYEKYQMHDGDQPYPEASLVQPSSNQNIASGRARRDSAARAMQGWHSQRNLGNGDVAEPIIKDKTLFSTPKREKQMKTVGLLKRKHSYPAERAAKGTRTNVEKPQMDSMVVDAGPPADWVKINVRKTKDCYEVYALVPGLLREEVRVQSDPVGRLVISGEPEYLDNPWGVTPFKKVVSLPSRIDPHQTSAVVTLHGQLFVRVPFEASDL